ncbi:MAG: DUF1592 domain-containing protein [Nannocystaceae bacterium]
MIATPMVLWLALAATACRDGSGKGDDGGDSGSATSGGSGSATDSSADSTDTGDVPPEQDAIARVGMRRLTRYEFDNVVRDILLDGSRPAAQLLPEDPRTPFDNDYTLQVVSQPLVDGIEVLAKEAAERLLEDGDKRDTVVGCQPSGVDDEACMRAFVTRFGRLALRRPLEAAEVDDFTALALDYAGQGDDFYVGVEVVIRALLQDAEFVYRVELGTPVEDQPGVFALSRYELASRMSFFLMGTSPDAALLDAVEAGELDTADGVRARAQMMLSDPRVHEHVDRFHSLWLGYAELPHPQDLTNAMRTETAALVERVVFDERRPWTDMLTSTETWVTPALAEHYGLPAPAEPAWVAYPDDGRAGLLSHGAFLSVGAKFGDTSPTQRGKLVRTKLFCQEIPKPPPDLMVDVCAPPPADPDACKVDRYFMSHEPACSGCHSLMDPIGFGLEAYDASGVFRATELDRPECVISGDGDFVGLGTFNGPAQLAALAVGSDALQPCVAQQLYRFAVGRTTLDAHDEALLERVAAESVADGGLDMLGFISGYVGSEAFRYRREEAQ